MYRKHLLEALTTFSLLITLAFMLALVMALASVWTGPQSHASAASNNVSTFQRSNVSTFQRSNVSTFHPALTPTPTTSCRPWSVVPSANVNPWDAHYLKGISAISSDDAWAVGYYGGSSSCCYQMLTEHWDGTGWSVVPSPNVSSTLNAYLYSVAAISTTDVWAVGYSEESATGQTHALGLHWDGTQWNIAIGTNAANPQVQTDKLLGVSAVATNDVWAVGYSTDNAITTLTMHWDGSQWTVVPGANTRTSINRLYAVSTISANNVWAVGEYELSGPPSNVLVTHWDGTSWRVVQVPFGGLASELRAISASSANDVWAVGITDEMGETPLSLVMHWNGTDWAIPSNADLPDVVLNGVAAISPNNVWAVGSHAVDGHLNTFIELWNGTQWNTVPSPAPSDYNHSLSGIAALSASDVWAVGNYGVSSSVPDRTLTERYTGGITFSDVLPTDYFYEAVNWLYCGQGVSGYLPDNTFRPYNETTRAQLSKIIVRVEGWPIDTHGGPHFTDVPTTSPFYNYIETAYNRGIIAGYADGTFRPGNSITRSQLCKIIVLAQGWQLQCPSTPHFTDVPPSNPFYCHVETAYAHGIISGYADGTFHPGESARRGQISKILYNALNGP